MMNIVKGGNRMTRQKGLFQNQSASIISMDKRKDNWSRGQNLPILKTGQAHWVIVSLISTKDSRLQKKTGTTNKFGLGGQI